jgi:hypothetical protein
MLTSVLLDARNQPIILTSNKAFGEWGHVFAEDSVMASAALNLTQFDIEPNGWVNLKCSLVG